MNALTKFLKEWAKTIAAFVGTVLTNMLVAVLMTLVALRRRGKAIAEEKVVDGFRLSHQLIDADALHAGHARDGLALAVTLDHEHGIDQIRSR